ncbi:hypothetical protein K438DRAFT_937437 [Mycena galopus ATCC 62051]|nr:hypothetical protein K438DRAFT_937437 [Mycena galopus ATCC 62051]
MEEWNHARFWSTLRLLQCPYQGCDHTFDIDDAIPLGSFPHRESCVECPHCEGLLCKTCRSVWHENMTCFMYQTLPRNEEPVRKRHGWAPTLHTSPSQNGGKRSARADSPGGMYNPGSMYSTPSTGSADSLNYGAESSYSPESPPYSTGAPYTPRESPRNQRRPPPWAHGHDKQSYF